MNYSNVGSSNVLVILILSMGTIIKLTPSEDDHFSGGYLAVNKLITDKMQNIFLLIAECSGFIKYTLNKIHKII